MEVEKAKEKSNSKISKCYLDWFTNIAVIVLVSILTYKIINSNISIDIATLLSILLAFFAMGLSVAFYFKTTETSNRFYDNTYQYTKNFAELLNRIEGMFGEKLNNLDRHYENMQHSLDSLKMEKTQVEEEVTDEEGELARLQKEKDELYQELLEKSKLSEQEKAKFIEELKEKDQQLEEKSQALLEAKRRLRMLESRIHREASAHGELSHVEQMKTDRRLRRYLMNELIPILGKSLLTKSPATIQRMFKRSIDMISPLALRDMRKMGYINKHNVLTESGIDMLINLAQDAVEMQEE